MTSQKSQLSNTAAKISLKFPYLVDYNDHFETPLVAYEDILPLLDSVGPPTSSKQTATNHKKNKKRKRNRNNQEGTTSQNENENENESTNQQGGRSSHILYDPYYCNGRTKSLLQSLNFSNVQHEKRDFYKDIQDQTIPQYHTLITNPPYSGTHKERCVRYAVEQLRCLSSGVDGSTSGGSGGSDDGKAFFLLMPNYIACRDHFRSAILSSTKHKSTNGIDNDNDSNNSSGGDPVDIHYVIPSTPYEYDHPEGTGKDISPFASIWFCGIPRGKVNAAKDAFRRTYGDDSIGLPSQRELGSNKPRLVSTLKELEVLGVVPTKKRQNPARRKKERLKRQQLEGVIVNHQQNNSPKKGAERKPTNQTEQNYSKKKSIYRDKNGKRKKRRF